MLGKIDDNFIFTFGKHKGKKICNVPAQYLLWAERNIENLSQRIRDYIDENRILLEKEARIED